MTEPDRKTAYGNMYQEHLLEQYKLYANSALQVTAWRSSTNNFFLTLNTALISLYGIASAFQGAAVWQRCVCLGGIVLGVIWWLIIESFRTLNSAKFEVIHEMEAELPFNAFDKEWTIWQSKSKIPTLTRVERVVPCGFIVIFTVLLLLSFCIATETQPLQIQLELESEPLNIDFQSQPYQIDIDNNYQSPKEAENK